MTDTKHKIILSSLTIIKRVGIEGLTMRLAAKEAGLSLGNLQYHYKNKKELINAIADYYFGECIKSLDSNQTLSSKEEIKEFIYDILSEATGLSDMCLIFREVWASSTRDKDLSNKLDGYYSELLTKLSLQFKDYPKEQTDKAISIILPYVEGYSLTNRVLPLNIDELSDLISNIVFDILNSNNK